MFSAEAQILRVLAVAGLAAALAATALMAVNSGVLKRASEPPASGAAAAASGGPQAQPDRAGQAPAASGSAPTDKSYTVQEGDSFFSISRKLNISIGDIQQKNPNLDPSNLVPGTKITIP